MTDVNDNATEIFALFPGKDFGFESTAGLSMQNHGAIDPKPTLQNGKQLRRIGSPAASCDRLRMITSVRRSRRRTERFAEIAAEFVNEAV